MRILLGNGLPWLFGRVPAQIDAPSGALDYVDSVVQTSDDFYRAAMRILREAGIPFLVGGAYALGAYTGISRETKDFDLLLRATDVARALERFHGEGFEAEMTFPHWLAK